MPEARRLRVVSRTVAGTAVSAMPGSSGRDEDAAATVRDCPECGQHDEHLMMDGEWICHSCGHVELPPGRYLAAPWRESAAANNRRGTAISWTEETWNPWMGCTKVSAGCDHCYMFREQRQYGHDPEILRRSKTKFDFPLKLEGSALIFTCSWSDWFHIDADQWRDEAWEIIRQTPQHTYQILTKRPGRILRHLPADWGDGYPNVWLGTSVETNEYLSRVRVLRDVPAVLRFISAEPLLGPLPDLDLDGVGWVITGGESGPQHRPIQVEWVREIRDACLTAGIPFHHKQWGGLRPKSGGKLLDGREWCEIPPHRELVA